MMPKYGHMWCSILASVAKLLIGILCLYVYGEECNGATLWCTECFG